MSKIQQNSTFVSTNHHTQNAIQNNANQYLTIPKQTSIRDEFVKQHKKNGLIERLYNGIKNLTGLGTGSKKALKAVENAENGYISAEEAQETIKKYRNSQQSSAQALADGISVAASGATFFTIRNLIKRKTAESLINEKAILENKGFTNKIEKFLLDLGKNNKKITGIAIISAATVGAFIKSFVSKVNRIGSKEFKVDKKDYNNLQTEADKKEYKAAKKNARRAKRGTNFRNFMSGAINGLMMPLTLVGGAFVGVPMFLFGNSLNKYFVGTRTEEKKSLKGYGENLKNDGLLHAAVGAAIAVPLIKKGQFTKAFDNNLNKAVSKLKDATLKPSEFVGTSTYQELDNILMGSKAIDDIVRNDKISIAEKVKLLSEENIFAVKFKQISGDKSPLSRALQEDCPPTRCFLKSDGKTWDLSEVQSFVDKNLTGKYQIKQCIGVGTIAETYLAKDANGKEVCLKILKKGIDESKIKADKQKFIDIINNLDPSIYTKEQKEYFIKNIDDLADGILKEVNFTNEAEAAKSLVKSTKVANIVKPLKVENGIYVMEKANGISLKSLVELNMAYCLKDTLENNKIMKDILLEKIPKDSKLGTLLKDVKTDAERIKVVNDYIKKVESKTPQFGDIKLSTDDFNFLIEEYEQVLVEQFHKVDKNGKVLHADIHPGNIFIDINALKNRKMDTVSGVTSQFGFRKPAKIFTLIDTGNTVNQTMQQALDSINLTSFVERGNYKDLARYVVKDSKGVVSEEKMAEIIEKELKQMFLDTETHIGNISNEDLLSISSNIMRKHGVMPANTQLNLNKAKHSAKNSLNELIEQLVWLKMKDVKGNTSSIVSTIGGMVKDSMSMMNKYKQMVAQQEKMNLMQMSKEQIQRHKKNPNMPATNSEEYLLYKLKQAKKAPEIKF